MEKLTCVCHHDVEAAQRSGFRLFSSSDLEWASQSVMTHTRHISSSSSDRLIDIVACHLPLDWLQVFAYVIYRLPL